MVEGHSVHRVAHRFASEFVGKAFKATSPNGRFTEGAGRIDNATFESIQAVGKNLFCFFGTEQPTVMHVHFGMAGAWALYTDSREFPEPRTTTRLRLEGHGMLADLSAMTVEVGDVEWFESKRSKLGEDPLRSDAHVERLWAKVATSKKSIGALIMDQSVFCGPGNIYRAEILFKAGIHPNMAGNSLTRLQFDRIWHHTVALLRRGYIEGSILTVDDDDPVAKKGLRRYIYNQARCGRCCGPVKNWDIAGRTCYACLKCQPSSGHCDEAEECRPFISHCVPLSAQARLAEGGPRLLTLPELKAELLRRGLDVPKGRKAALVAALEAAGPEIKSAVEAAQEKAAAGESRGVEHIAELAPSQASAAGHAGARLCTKKRKTAHLAVRTPPKSAPKKPRSTRAGKLHVCEHLGLPR